MSTATVLEREEYVEQAYLFRTVRERLADNQAAQDVFQRVGEELLSSTRLPYAVAFLAAELKHTGISSLRDSEVLKALVFLLRLAHARTSGRSKSRAFVEFLFAQFPEQESAVVAFQGVDSRIIMP